MVAEDAIESSENVVDVMVGRGKESKSMVGDGNESKSMGKCKETDVQRAKIVKKIEDMRIRQSK